MMSRRGWRVHSGKHRKIIKPSSISKVLGETSCEVQSFDNFMDHSTNCCSQHEKHKSGNGQKESTSCHKQEVL